MALNTFPFIWAAYNIVGPRACALFSDGAKIASRALMITAKKRGKYLYKTIKGVLIAT